MVAPTNLFSDTPPPNLAEDLPYLEQLKQALVDSDGLDHIPQPEPLIDGILYQDSLAWMQGKSGDGKSFVALDMAGSIGTGRDWHGYTVTQGFVLYMAAEGAAGIKQRVRAWEHEHGQPMTGVKFLPVAVQAGLLTQWLALRELVAELCPTLIVIDTQARVTVGLEENAAKDMGEFVDKLEKLRQEAGSTVLVVHHQGRSGDHMRGSTALYGSADTEIQVTRDDRDVVVKCGKQKNAEEFTDITLAMTPVLDSVVLKTADWSSRGSGSTTAGLKMARQWWDLFEGDTISATLVLDTLKMSKSAFYRHVKDLVADGFVGKDTSTVNARYRMLRNPHDWL